MQSSPNSLTSLLYATAVVVEQQEKAKQEALEAAAAPELPRACSTCYIMKPAQEFYLRANGTSRRSQCKSCYLIKKQETKALTRQKHPHRQYKLKGTKS